MKHSTAPSTAAGKLADKVIAGLQKDISMGKYRPGDRIPPEPELMEAYNVGRSTIREAIKTLASAGLLKVQQGAGTFITQSPATTEPLAQRLRRAELKEVNDVRFILEKEIIRLAVQHHTKKDIQAMQKALAGRSAALEAADEAACEDADIALHMAIALASHNSVLADLYQAFTHTIRDFFRKRSNASIASFASTHVLHVQLVDAIIHKKAAAALQLTIELLQKNY